MAVYLRRGPVSLHTDEDFREAAALWTRSQTFIRKAIDPWDIPKLIIENKGYLWEGIYAADERICSISIDWNLSSRMNVSNEWLA